jgi:hypothetical protein
MGRTATQPHSHGPHSHGPHSHRQHQQAISRGPHLHPLQLPQRRPHALAALAQHLQRLQLQRLGTADANNLRQSVTKKTQYLTNNTEPKSKR